jgi:hypothetical protein
MTSKKTPSRFKEWLPPLIFGGFFIGLIAIPQLRDKFFPAVTTHIVEWKDKIVQVEKEKVVHERPTVSVNTVKVTVTQVTDGDTIHAEIELPLGVKLINQRIRCLGYDAYELSELKGLDAKNELEAICKDGEVFGMTAEHTHDSFGRVLLRLFVRKNDKVIDVANDMTQRGFVKPEKAKVEDSDGNTTE